MARHFSDWLAAFMDYTSGTEAPRRMHFWTGVATIAGAIRRKVWVDMKRFQWTPNFYIIFVAPPGIISKTTTMNMGMDLLKKVPGIKFGPDVVTWQALATRFAEVGEMFQYGEEWLPMSPLTLASGEFGNLINPQDREMLTFYISMWDGVKTFDKVTKGSGCDSLESPWINMIGCTTPHWIADNMPAAAVGGGFTSRCVFVYGDKKEAYIAWPDEFVKPDHDAFTSRLIDDLEHISTALSGPMTISKEARAWGAEWYKHLWTEGVKLVSDDRLEGYLARKQTHLVKLGMILSLSRGDSLEISLEDLVIADTQLRETEPDLDKVFSRIGRTEQANHAERFIRFVRQRSPVDYAVAFRYIHSQIPDFHDFEGMLEGAIRSGQIRMEFYGQPRMVNGKMMQDARLVYTGA